jgi:hypothetical protein
MGTIVKVQRDPRAAERAAREKAGLEQFIKENIIDAIITKAHCYGESLAVCRDIQRKFEMRPVTKFVYPLLLQFQFSVAGVQPKSLQAMNSLGQIMFLNRNN